MDILVNAIVQVAMFSVVPYLWWLITAREKESFFRWIGLKKPIIKGSLIKFLIIIFGTSGIYILFMFIVMTYFLEGVHTAINQFQGEGLGALLYIVIYAVIQTSLSEEILFRGFIGKRLIGRFGFAIGNTAQALLFGLLHGVPFGLVTGNIIVAILLTLIPGFMGWIEGWLNEKYASGSIVPSWIIHAVMNFLSALSMAL